MVSILLEKRILSCSNTFFSFSAPDCDSSSRTLLKGVFSKGFDINVVPGSLKVVEEPSDCFDAVIGSSVTFACLGESQGGPVTYQWMHNDKLLLGEIDYLPIQSRIYLPQRFFL